MFLAIYNIYIYLPITYDGGRVPQRKHCVTKKQKKKPISQKYHVIVIFPEIYMYIQRESLS